MNNFKKISILFLFCLALSSSVAFAQSIPIGDIPGTSEDKPFIECGNSNPEECDLKQLAGLAQNGLNLTFALAAFIATGMFIYAGFLMITASGNAGQISKAKTVFTRVVVGFLIMFMAFLLVQNLLKRLELSNEGKSVINNVIDVQ